MAEILRPKKKAESTDLSTKTLGCINTRPGSFLDRNKRKVKILFDTGCGATLIHQSFVTKLTLNYNQLSNWSTKAGSFKTTKTCKVNIMLPAFHEKCIITWTAFVDETNQLSNRYDMIIGRDLISELGMSFWFNDC